MKNHTALGAADIAHGFPQYTDLIAHAERGPLVFTGAEGVYLIDEHGRRYLEGMSGLWCAGLGYSQPRLVEAAQRQMSTLPYSHLFAHRATDRSIELAEALSQIAPVPGMRPFFVNSGSEAIDAAIKLCWYIQRARGEQQRRKILVRRGAYHGVTVAGAALTGLSYTHYGFGLPMDHAVRLSTPHHFREAQDGESEAAFCARLLDELRETIDREGAHTIAAFFAEPVMGAGGVLIPPAGYFEGVQAILREHGILMVADEVICGLGRTGEWWGSQRFGITPDLVTSAKQLSAAFIPIGAVLVAPGVWDDLARASHEHGMYGSGHTYGGHPVACAVTLEALAIYRELDIPHRVRALEGAFAEGLQKLAGSPIVGQARSVGLIGALELVADPDTGRRFEPGDRIAQRLAEAALKESVVIRPVPGDTVAMCPPMIISEAELQELLEGVGRALAVVDGLRG